MAPPEFDSFDFVRVQSVTHLVLPLSVDVFGPTEIFRDRIVSVAVPAKELFFTWGP